jgi:hypothetical protein
MAQFAEALQIKPDHAGAKKNLAFAEARRSKHNVSRGQ